MSMNRWKILACTLTVGVGGLAVCAAPFGKKAEAQNAKTEKAPAPVILGSDTTTPTVIKTVAEPTPPAPLKGIEFDIDIPVLPAPKKPNPEETTPPPAVKVPVIEAPPVLIPVKGEETAPPKKDEPKPLDPPKIELPKIEAPTPKPIDLPKIDVPAPKKPDMVLPPMPPKPVVPVVKPGLPDVKKPVKNDDFEIPSVKPIIPDLKPTPPPVVKPEPVKPEPVKPVVKGDTSKLKMLLRMGDGKPRFEIRNTQTTELLMKVYGDRMEIQTPPDGKTSLSGVTANGNVRFTAPGVEGTCDQLTILSGTGEVLLKGNIHLKAKFGKSSSEITAEKMVYQIGAQGLVAPAGTKPTFTPAGYVPE